MTREMGRMGVVAGLCLFVAGLEPGARLGLATEARVASHRTRATALSRASARLPRREGAGGVSGERSAGGAQEVDTLTVGSGAAVRLTLLDSISTRSSAAGDTFRAEIAEPVYDGERIALPLGAVVTGRVAEVRESGGARERAVLHTGFLHVQVEGDTIPFAARLLETNPVMTSRISTLERSAKIGGGALVGGLAGAYFTGGTGALAGAAVGGLAAAVWVMSTQDVDVVLPAGSALRVRTTREIEVVR